MDKKWAIALSVSLGTLMGAIDQSILNVALPQIQGAVGATFQQLTWVSTAYTMALVVLMPLAPFLGRRFGQKRVYLTCLGLFLVGSFLAGFATTLPMLIGCRVLQGLGAGVLQPTEQAILRRTFPPGEQGMAMAVFGVVIMLGPAIGPSLGGYVLAHGSWSWIFFLNLPVGLAGFTLVALVLPDDGTRSDARTDWLGVLLLTIALSMGEYVLEEGQGEGWLDSRRIASILAIALAALAAFVAHALTTDAPVVDLRLFKDRVFSAGIVLNATMMSTLLATLFLQPLFMEQVLRLSPMQSATALLPRSIVLMVAIFVVGSIYEKVPAKPLIVAGILVSALGAFDMSHLTAESGYAELFRCSAIQGLGFALVFVPMETAMLSRVPPERVPDATAMTSLFGEMGGAIGLAICGSLFERRLAFATASITAQVTPAVLFRHPHLDVITPAAVLAYEHMFALAGLVFLAVTPFVLMLRTQKAS